MELCKLCNFNRLYGFLEIWHIPCSIQRQNLITQVDRFSFDHAQDGEPFDFAHDHELVEWLVEP